MQLKEFFDDTMCTVLEFFYENPNIAYSTDEVKKILEEKTKTYPLHLYLNCLHRLNILEKFRVKKTPKGPIIYCYELNIDNLLVKNLGELFNILQYTSLEKIENNKTQKKKFYPMDV